MDKQHTDGDNKRKLSLISIVIDDVDSSKLTDGGGGKTATELIPEKTTPDDSIKKLLEEAEHRKLEFGKLIDEHSAVIENLKKIENRDVEPTCKQPIMRRLYNAPPLVFKTSKKQAPLPY